MNFNDRILMAINKGLNEALADSDLDFNNINQKSQISNKSIIIKAVKQDVDAYMDQVINQKFKNCDDILLKIDELCSNINYEYKYRFKDSDANKLLKKLCDTCNRKVLRNISLNWVDTSNVANMYRLFNGSKYNGDISEWDVSNVEDMSYMFSDAEFNNNSICNWNVSSVKNMQGMFYRSQFAQSLKNWKLNPNVQLHNMFAAAQYLLNDNCSLDFINNFSNCLEIFGSSNSRDESRIRDDSKRLPGIIKTWYENGKLKSLREIYNITIDDGSYGPVTEIGTELCIDYLTHRDISEDDFNLLMTMFLKYNHPEELIDLCMNICKKYMLKNNNYSDESILSGLMHECIDADMFKKICKGREIKLSSKLGKYLIQTIYNRVSGQTEFMYADLLDTAIIKIN